MKRSCLDFKMQFVNKENIDLKITLRFTVRFHWHIANTAERAF